jgi:hypothetical protein
MTHRLPQELVLHTEDTLGTPVDVAFGIVTDAKGRQRMALTIGEDGPTAVLNYDDGTGPNLLPIARRTLATLIRNGTP